MNTENTLELLVRLRDGDAAAGDRIVERALPRLKSFKPEGPGALLAFLKRAVRNQVVDEIRRAQRRPEPCELRDSHADPAPSPLEQAIMVQGLAKYRAALATLSPLDQALIIERAERWRNYEGSRRGGRQPNAAAARVAVSRALVRLIAEFEHQARARQPLS